MTVMVVVKRENLFWDSSRCFAIDASPAFPSSSIPPHYSLPLIVSHGHYQDQEMVCLISV